MNEDENTKNETTVGVPSSEPKKKKSNGNRLKHHFCKDCKWYDKESEREFHRKVGKKDEQGLRTEIVEVRGACGNPQASSYRHLVMAEYLKRQCSAWQAIAHPSRGTRVANP